VPLATNNSDRIGNIHFRIKDKKVTGYKLCVYLHSCALPKQTTHLLMLHVHHHQSLLVFCRFWPSFEYSKLFHQFWNLGSIRRAHFALKNVRVTCSSIELLIGSIGRIDSGSNHCLLLSLGNENISIQNDRVNQCACFSDIPEQKTWFPPNTCTPTKNPNHPCWIVQDRQTQHVPFCQRQSQHRVQH